MSTHLTSTGVDFEAHGGSNVNLLDDYEEGTWTLAVAEGTVLQADAGNPHYRKVGQIVQVRYSSTTFSDKTSTEKLSWTGWPFASERAYTALGVIWTYNVTNIGECIMMFATTTSVFCVQQHGGTTFESALTYNAMLGNPNMYMNGVYETT